MRAKEYIRQIVENSNNEDMESLEQIFYESLRFIEENSLELYDDMCMRLYVLAYGECLDNESAIEAVEKMKPYGEHWTIEQTTDVAKTNGVTFDKFTKESWYWTMNMAYNDYSSLFGNDLGMYVRFSKAFLNDADMEDSDAKVFRYIQAMKKED